MDNGWWVRCQWLVQRGLTWIARRCGSVRVPAIKNRLIDHLLMLHPVRMDEAEEPNPYAFPTYGAFFERALRPGVRPMPNDPKAWVSPVDSAVGGWGTLNGTTLVQAKGQSYTLEALLTRSDWSDALADGVFLTQYLAPHDYHRIHMPCDARLVAMVYVPGLLFSVKPAVLANEPCLFARNERLVVWFETPDGPLAMVLVGAMLVSGMSVVWEPKPVGSGRGPRTWTYDDAGITLRKGEEMGRFHFGSTVVMAWKPQHQASEGLDHAWVWDAAIAEGATVKLHQALGRVPTLKQAD